MRASYAETKKLHPTYTPADYNNNGLFIKTTDYLLKQRIERIIYLNTMFAT